MKRYIRQSKYIEQSSDPIILDDTVVVDIEIDLSDYIKSATSSNTVLVPGIEKFRKDVCDILENEYGFEVIEDNYRGRKTKQKGYFSDRHGSFSVYFDTYYDLSKSEPVFKRLGMSNYTVPNKGKVYCFIHLRFSDHDLYNEGDAAHRRFLRTNREKYTANRSDITHVVDEERIKLSHTDMQRHYDEAIDDLKYELDTKILNWVRKANKYKKP